MAPFAQSRIPSQRGVTILEVLASVSLILLGLSAIFGMNAQSLQVLRRAQQIGAATQVLQERIETLRTTPWPQISRGATLASLWSRPTEGAADLADASPTEILTIEPSPSPGVPAPAASRISLERRNGKVSLLQNADLNAEVLLLVELKIQWREQQSTRERILRTIIGRDGLTRSGVFGSAFGRTGSGEEEPQ